MRPSTDRPPTFAAGFRLSATDVAVLVAGAVGAVALWRQTWWWGLVVGFVVGHFFLFCNVFRIARRLELAWAGVFVVLVAATVAFNVPGWPVTLVASLSMTFAIIAIELRKPSYHGIGWQWVNPGLTDWWNANRPFQRQPNVVEPENAD